MLGKDLVGKDLVGKDLVGASLLANSALVVLQAARPGTLLRGPLQAAIHGRSPKAIHGL